MANAAKCGPGADVGGKASGLRAQPAHPQGGPKPRVFTAVLGITRTDWHYLRVSCGRSTFCAQQPVGARLIQHNAIELALQVLLKRTNPLAADALPTRRPPPVSCPDEVFDVGHVASRSKAEANPSLTRSRRLPDEPLRMSDGLKPRRY